jgi:hypothetical protein
MKSYSTHQKIYKLQVQVETLVIEKKNPATGIVELINQHHITRLAMGASSISTYVQMQCPSPIMRLPE